MPQYNPGFAYTMGSFWLASANGIALIENAF
jgi:hypothetical protein